MFRITIGGTRVIVMMSKIVLKFPRKHRFAEGVLQNKTEWKRRNVSGHLATLYFSFPFGLCNVMERIEPLSEQEYGDKWSADFIRDYFKSRECSKEELKLLLEDCAIRNFGKKNGEILKLDWGGYGKCK